MDEEKKKEDYNEYEDYDRDIDEPTFLTDHDKDAWLDTPKIKRRIIEPEDILTKDLRNSFIDSELAFIFGQLTVCAEDWRNLGMNDLAKRSHAQNIAQLSTFASVDGKERISQLRPTLEIKSPFKDINTNPNFSPPRESDDFSSKKRFGR